MAKTIKTKVRAKTSKVLPKKKAINWKKYIGCVGWFNEKGRLIVVPNLKAFKMETKSIGPDFYLMSVQGPDLLISPNALSIHRFPKKYSKILKP